jgi:hypothetical protein
MTPKCRTQLNAVRAQSGQPPLTDAQVREIDSRLSATMRRLARTDPDWQTYPPDARLQIAGQQAVADVKAEAQRRVENAQRQAIKAAELEERLQAYTARQGGTRAKALVEDFSLTSAYIDGIKRDGTRQLMGLIEAASSGQGASTGRRVLMALFDAENPTMSRDLALEVFAQGKAGTGNALAKQGADAWLKVTETLRQRFNNAGGDVGKLDYGYLPQAHDQTRVLAAGRDGWAAEVLPMLDRTRYVNEDGSRMSDAQVLDTLKGAWETISSDGANKSTPGAFKGSGAKANRGSESREIHFKDGEQYLAYLGKFGVGSMYDAMIGHLGGLSRDLGLVERYGPNPEAQMRVQFDLAERADGKRTGFWGQLGDNMAGPRAQWAVLSGASGQAEYARVAQIGQNIRNIETFGKLQGAVLASFTDLGSYVVTTGYNKLPYWQALANIGRATSKETRDFLNAHGAIAESMVSDMNRWAGENIQNNWSGRITNATMRLSLMNAWTDTLRRAFSMTMMNGLARMSRTEWDSLTPYDRWRMEQKGITADDWDVMRAAPLVQHRGMDFISPDAIYSLPDTTVLTASPRGAERIRQRIDAETGDLLARNAKEQEWIAGRLDKFDAARDSMNRAVKDLRAKKLAKNEKAAEELQERIDLLETQVEQAKLQAELESDYNKLFTKADAEAFEAGMRAAASDLNRASSAAVSAADRAGEKFGRRRQRIESKMRAIEKRMTGLDGDEKRMQQMAAKQVELERAALERDIEEAFKAFPKDEREAFRAAVDSFGDVRRSANEGIRSAEAIGRRYGEQKGRLQRRIQELEKRIGEMDRQTDREMNVAGKEAQAKAEAMAKELAEFVKKSQERQGRRLAVIDRIERSEAPQMAAEAQRIRGEVVAKMIGMVTDESEVAVLNPDLTTKAIASGGGKTKGSVEGELWRSVMQFKSFPIAMISRHWRRMLETPQDLEGAPVMASKLAYSAAMMVSLTALGAIAFQSKQLVTGKDPVDMTTPKFWTRAVAQGGGLGFVGDLLLGDTTDDRSPLDSFGRTIMGPTFGSAADLYELTKGNVDEALAGKDSHAGAEAFRFARSHAPLVNLWYAKRALDAAALHGVQESLSPGYMARIQNKARKDWGQDFWWAPGEGAPERAPDLTTVGGN